MFHGNQQKVVELMAGFKLSPSGSQLSAEFLAKIVKIEPERFKVLYSMKCLKGFKGE